MSVLRAAALLLLLAAPVWAVQGMDLAVGDAKAPVEIDADSMELRQRERVVAFSGAVTARRGDLSLMADRVEVKLKDQGEDVESIRATGSVRVKKGELLASGAAAVYDVAGDVITLTGEPKVWRGRDAVAGEVIRVHLTDERVEVERARAILYPSGKPGEGKP